MSLIIKYLVIYNRVFLNTRFITSKYRRYLILYLKDG